jgi:hypothetical protein
MMISHALSFWDFDFQPTILIIDWSFSSSFRIASPAPPFDDTLLPLFGFSFILSLIWSPSSPASDLPNAHAQTCLTRLGPKDCQRNMIHVARFRHPDEPPSLGVVNATIVWSGLVWSLLLHPG